MSDIKSKFILTLINNLAIISLLKFVGVSPSGKAPDSDSGIPRFESSYPSHIKKARFGELFAFLRSFNVECDVDTSYPSMSDATLPRLIRPTVGTHPAML